MNLFLSAFIPLFVAIDIIALIPIFLGLTQGIDPEAKRKLITQAVITASAISLLFLISGDLLFGILGITAGDFKIGGGIILLILSIHDLLFSAEKRRASGAIGIVPIGTPLIMGPAGLTTILIINKAYGFGPTLLALLLNMGVVWLGFRFAPAIYRIMGEAGALAFAKVASLFLAGIAIMMIRVGIQSFFP